MTRPPSVIKPQPIDAAAYSDYGEVIAAARGRAFKDANLGRARRFDRLSEVRNLRPGTATLNLCIFRCQPAAMPLEIRLLERHPFSTQVFLPMRHDARYLVVVALGGDAPDLASLRAFLVEGAQGISYKPGIWHYPMTALDKEIDFSCLIWEDGSQADCELFDLERPISVEV